MSTTRFYSTLIRNEEGVTAIEYGLLTGLIGVLLVLGLTTIGNTIAAVFVTLAAAI